MIAIVIMMVGMLGLLQSLNIAMEFNLKNHLRDEAVSVGQKYMNIQRGKVFDRLSASYGTRYEPSKVRGTGKLYSVDMSTDELSADAKTPAKLLKIEVKWTYKGVEYINKVTSPVSVIR